MSETLPPLKPGSSLMGFHILLNCNTEKPPLIANEHCPAIETRHSARACLTPPSSENLVIRRTSTPPTSHGQVAHCSSIQIHPNIEPEPAQLSDEPDIDDGQSEESNCEEQSALDSQTSAWHAVVEQYEQESEGSCAPTYHRLTRLHAKTTGQKPTVKMAEDWRSDDPWHM